LRNDLVKNIWAIKGQSEWAIWCVLPCFFLPTWLSMFSYRNVFCQHLSFNKSHLSFNKSQFCKKNHLIGLLQKKLPRQKKWERVVYWN
jgi:hypothetical protein